MKGSESKSNKHACSDRAYDVGNMGPRTNNQQKALSWKRRSDQGILPEIETSKVDGIKPRAGKV